MRDLISNLTAKTVVIVGGYGSGKSELAVNFALRARQERDPVAIIDMDIVNPYFRCREARDLMRSRAIDVIIPPGEQVYADLPIIVPRVRTTIEDPKGLVVLDVGGDDVGSRVLGSFKGVFNEAAYEMWFVLNRSRPFTQDVPGARRMIAEIEGAARLRMTGIVSNTHMMEETTPEMVVEGLELAREVGRELELPVVMACAMEPVAAKIEPDRLETPIFSLIRHLAPPWLAGVRPASLDARG